MLKLRLEHDEDTENPCEYGGWQFVAFHRHSRDRAADYIESVDRDGRIKWANIGLARKIETGTAFILSCYEHGQVQWGLRGETHQCRWDTASIAGLLIWKDKLTDLPITKGDKLATYKAREAMARSFLEEYTQWCNGECYHYHLEDDVTGLEDSCGGFIDADYLAETVRKIVQGREIGKITGEAADLAYYYDFKGKAPEVPA